MQITVKNKKAPLFFRKQQNNNNMPLYVKFDKLKVFNPLFSLFWLNLLRRIKKPKNFQTIQLSRKKKILQTQSFLTDFSIAKKRKATKSCHTEWFANWTHMQNFIYNHQKNSPKNLFLTGKKYFFFSSRINSFLILSFFIISWIKSNFSSPPLLLALSLPIDMIYAYKAVSNFPNHLPHYFRHFYIIQFCYYYFKSKKKPLKKVQRIFFKYSATV